MKLQFNIGHIDPLTLLGVKNRNLKRLQESFEVQIIYRGTEIICIGKKSDILQAQSCIKELIHHIEKHHSLTDSEFITYIRLNQHVDTVEDNKNLYPTRKIILHSEHNFIKPQNENQAKLYKSIEENDLVFSIGPAGTGKTYLAVAIAVSLLKSHKIKKIILTRPVVQTGEDLGFLPGDFKTKVNPYLRPLLDALDDFMEQDQLKKYLEQEIIEIAPLAYMRGRTLNNAFVILDEAQNTTNGQMKMFLTRLGKSSKAIITGDITQIDLTTASISGLIKVQDILKDIRGIDFVYFTKSDVLRHRLIRDIIDAFETKPV